MPPRVPNEILLKIAQLRCAHPECYDYNAMDSPHALDVPPYFHPEDWCARELLLANTTVYSLTSPLSWEVVLVISPNALPSIQAAVHRETFYLGEARLPRDVIRCLDLSFDLKYAEDEIYHLVSALPNLDTLVLSHAVHTMLVFCQPRSPADFALPQPLPTPFPTSLRAVLFASTFYSVTMEDINLISLMVPRLERLQVAKFHPPENTPVDHTTPSYLLNSLKWLAIGSFETRGNPSRYLTLLLDILSAGSGMVSLRRLDILADVRLPERFLNVQGSSITCISITGARHECLTNGNAFTRFEALYHLIILADPTLSSLPRSHNPSLSRISIFRPPSAASLLMADADVVTQMNEIITEVIAMSAVCPSLKRVDFVPPNPPVSADWMTVQKSRTSSRQISLSF
ncbi:hypothetical protein DFP72DRAFT_842723 [Ephemerocybe angulata]|uniref:Uncharacterized protein n=1 Tax=Ephemerocybe angulata TaxID=980116 RepID=A0A8H6LRQ5_9AGAR|nr:hypothetical protein DFP72DRAFT_1117393 [Tulosesus angulatus]KAF6761069.1 hypothetical protein DFP72DRAFT_842723 [Tulosesus angulatus]